MVDTLTHTQTSTEVDQMARKRKRRRRRKMSWGARLSLFLLALPAIQNVVGGPPTLEGKALRLRRDYGAVDENGKFRPEFLARTYGAALIPIAIKKGLQWFGTRIQGF